MKLNHQNLLLQEPKLLSKGQFEITTGLNLIKNIFSSIKSPQKRFSTQENVEINSSVEKVGRWFNDIDNDYFNS